jgi:hypothetical protein
MEGKSAQHNLLHMALSVMEKGEGNSLRVESSATKKSRLKQRATERNGSTLGYYSPV